MSLVGFPPVGNSIVRLAEVRAQRKALGLYVLAGVPGHTMDFIEAVDEVADLPTLELLLQLLTSANADMSEENRRLNALGAPIVRGRLRVLADR